MGQSGGGFPEFRIRSGLLRDDRFPDEIRQVHGVGFETGTPQERCLENGSEWREEEESLVVIYSLLSPQVKP
ncbi:L-cysteine S-thiosulfotransferase subunit SoxA [Dissostichus eleginoides]|uniref:L-cysteine S-thiosulfotransferase subunit SoxA n=1 Tax=Dissostichus eleginoides TaxID=100907 RepID=A0AAD9FEE3_DISEL|nr:L-cysteine S-thiosulfotransferase subunit SoxA [Dissostichus eleginoides]